MNQLLDYFNLSHTGCLVFRPILYMFLNTGKAVFFSICSYHIYDLGIYFCMLSPAAFVTGAAECVLGCSCSLSAHLVQQGARLFINILSCFVCLHDNWVKVKRNLGLPLTDYHIGRRLMFNTRFLWITGWSRCHSDPTYF